MDPARGQFLSQDPVFWENPMAQDLKNPQNLNSYSYASNNPIIKTDATGRATYIWNNGAGMTGIDTNDPNTYYEQNDIDILNTNAAYMEGVSGSAWKYTLFTDKVRPGGEWDFKKNSRGYYFFEGELVKAEEYGNVHYGYTGSAGKISPTTLKVAGGVVQLGSSMAGPTKTGSVTSYFDDPRDTRNIQRGVDAYNKSIKTAAKSVSDASKALSSGNISGAIKALKKAISALKPR